MNRLLTSMTVAVILGPLPAAGQTPAQVVESRAVVRIEPRVQVTVQERERQTREREERERARARERAEKYRRDNRAQQSETIVRTVKIGREGRVEISNLAGDIIITRGSGDTVKIEAVKTARGRTEQDAKDALASVTLDILERDARLQIKTIYPRHDARSRENNRQTHVSVQFTITAPEGTRISAHSLSGDVKVSDIKGDLSIVSLSGDVAITNAARVIAAKSTSGNVDIVNLRSDVGLEAQTLSGDLILRDCRAPRLQLNTVSGDMRLHGVDAGRIEAQTLNGDIEFLSPLQKSGRYDLNSHAGDIRIVPSGNIGFELDVNSFSGSIESLLTLTDQREEAGYGRRGPGGRIRSLRGVHGDGGAMLDITTFSGSVVIGKK